MLLYLVRVLEPEKFGLIAFSQVFVGYFMILTDYGFNLSATRDTSINRENK
jgi:PST family polysaccharide transporter